MASSEYSGARILIGLMIVLTLSAWWFNYMLLDVAVTESEINYGVDKWSNLNYFTKAWFIFKQIMSSTITGIVGTPPVIYGLITLFLTLPVVLAVLYWFRGTQ